MIRFVICDDNVEVVEKTRLIVNKVMMPYDYDYKITRFKSYNSTFESIIKNNDEQKIYILDIELPGTTGLDIADKIREHDWNSIIIILTSHYECQDLVFESRLMVLDYISKFSKYEKTLEKSLKTALNILNQKKVLNFKYCHSTYRIPYDEILYIKVSPEKRTTIFTIDGNEYGINAQLKELLTKLQPNFQRCHKNCIVNVEKVREVNIKNDTITFKNGVTEKLMSFRMKRGFAEYVRKYKRYYWLFMSN